MTEMTEVIKSVKDIIKRHSLTQRDVAAEAGISEGQMSAVLNGKYTGDNGRAAKLLSVWLDGFRQRQALPDMPGFVETPTSRQLRDAFTFARAAGCMSTIVGTPGVGKTESALQYCAENRANTWMITLSPSRCSLTECLLELAEELGLPDRRRNKGSLSRGICRRLRGTRGLIIIDEADHLGVDGLEEFRAIQDATHVGMVLIGNPQGVLKPIDSRYATDELERLCSRIARPVTLKKAKKADVTALAEAWGITGDSELKLVYSIAARAGALRVLSHTLRQAWILARGAEADALSESHIRQAFKEVYGKDLSLKS
ncbi:AAA family ATPase [Salmonella enterica]|nr:AAA family ATPase [Salmonella enterica]